MCGICGVIGAKESERAGVTARLMMSKMVHRGPDDEAALKDHFVVLGIRRLSIIDLASGHQPVFNEDGTVAVVFNGEIYNFRELRRALESRGHTFRTNSDTEVIVHGYEEWGEDCVEHLQGMFALAIADNSKRAHQSGGRVLLARDRLGIKPLYYSQVGSKLLFASEVRALLATGDIPRRLSLSALWSYLLYGSVCEPLTLVEGIFSVPPGHRMVVPSDRAVADVRPEPYWNFAEAVRPAPDPQVRNRSEATTCLRPLLQDAVERHLVSDVPIGVFLSSGIDSTSLVALAAAAGARHSGSAVHTLTVVFPEQEFSEVELARRTAEHLRTEHREVLLSGEDMRARLDAAVRALDQPSIDGVNTYFVSWAARQTGLKVALSGLGGDEVFGGYSTFRSTPRARALADVGRRVPAPLRSAIATALGKLVGRRRTGSADRKLMALWRDPDSLPHPYFYTRLLFTPRQALDLISVEEAAISGPWMEWLVETARGASQLDNFAAVSCLEARSYMVNTLLRDTDAMSMAHSLEVRVPFLDHRIVEFVGRLPESWKRRNGAQKALLVATLSDLLPQEVVAQPKRGFTFPWESWFRSALREQIAAGIKHIAPPLQPVLSSEAVDHVWTDFLEGRTTWSRPWSLFVLSDWVRQHLDD